MQSKMQSKMRSTPPGHETKVVRDFVLAVMACTNGDPMLILDHLPREWAHASPRQQLESLLRTGRVDAAIKAQDRAYGWDNYTTYTYASEVAGEVTSEVTVRFRPGSFVALDSPLSLSPVSADALRGLMVHLVSVRGPYAANPPHAHNAEELVTALLGVLFPQRAVAAATEPDRGTPRPWVHHVVEPTFLRSSEGDVCDAEGNLSYFESEGTNLAWFSTRGDQFALFLLNAYPGFRLVLPGS